MTTDPQTYGNGQKYAYRRNNATVLQKKLNVEKGTVPNFTLLQGTDEQEEEAQEDQDEVDDFAP